MTDLPIRDLDPDAHPELKRLAELAGHSLQAYVAGLPESHAGRRARAEWFHRLHGLPPVPGVSGSEAVSAARDEMMRPASCSSLDLTRAPITARMLREAGALREDVTARDALYVTLARGLDAGLVTTDRRLARAVPDLVDR